MKSVKATLAECYAPMIRDRFARPMPFLSDEAIVAQARLYEALSALTDEQVMELATEALKDAQLRGA